MKVSELIELLKKAPQDLEVFTFYDYCMSNHLNEKQIVISDDDSDWYGPSGVLFCSQYDEDMDYLIEQRKFKPL